MADTLCIWALIVCSNQKVPDTSVITYIYPIINARTARTCPILSIWNRVGYGGNDASIPNFPALLSRVNIPYKSYIYKYRYIKYQILYTL